MQTAFSRTGRALAALVPVFVASAAFAGEADLKLPNVNQIDFGGGLTGWTIMMGGLAISVLGALFGLVQTEHTPGRRTWRILGLGPRQQRPAHASSASTPIAPPRAFLTLASKDGPH